MNDIAVDGLAFHRKYKGLWQLKQINFPTM